MEQLDGVEIIAFADGTAFEAWLAGHHTRQGGVWIKMARKGSGIPSVSSDELVDIGLRYGWISGQRRALDDRHYLQKYVPRRPRSLWSQVNVEKVERLTAMRPDARAWAGRGPQGAAGRAVGRGLRVAEDGDRAARPRGGPRRLSRGQGRR